MRDAYLRRTPPPQHFLQHYPSARPSARSGYRIQAFGSSPGLLPSPEPWRQSSSFWSPRHHDGRNVSISFETESHYDLLSLSRPIQQDYVVLPRDCIGYCNSYYRLRETPIALATDVFALPYDEHISEPILVLAELDQVRSVGEGHLVVRASAIPAREALLLSSDNKRLAVLLRPDQPITPQTQTPPIQYIARSEVKSMTVICTARIGEFLKPPVELRYCMPQ